MDSSKKNAICLGFLTVRKHPVHGYFGGLLILNTLARPIEFHCTLPVQTTKAQQILYGPTLDEFVCGEQIARALIQKAKSSPAIVLTDTLAALTLRHVHAQPTFAIEGTWDRSNSAFAQPTLERNDYFQFKAGSLQLISLNEYENDAKVALELFESEDLNLDFVEPFGRIEEALKEAHPATKAA